MSYMVVCRHGKYGPFNTKEQAQEICDIWNSRITAILTRDTHRIVEVKE